MAKRKSTQPSEPPTQTSPTTLTTTTATPRPPSKRTTRPTTLSTLTDTFLLLTLAALSSPISHSTLSPVFSSIPSATHNRPALILSTILAFTLHYLLPRTQRKRIAQWTATWTFWIPVIQAQLFRYSSTLGPTAGPAVLGFLACYSVVIASVYSAAETLEDLGLVERYGKWYATVTPAAVGTWWIVTASTWFESLLPKLALSSSIFSPISLQLMFASLYATLAPSPLLFYALPTLLHTLYLNPHFDSPTTTALLNTTLLSTHNWTLLARSWSLTGYISVLENQAQQYRVLRCDHSLLGGEWQMTPSRQREENWTDNQSIFSVFEMLEAVRLIDRGVSRDISETNALVIGLGIGTAAKALITHNISTTILELDPVIHHYAQRYFSFPIASESSDSNPTHKVYITDAIPFIKHTSANPTSPRYDYIIHDVFTGGAEPLSLFTSTFLENLKNIVKPQGAIAINYAGDLTLPLTTRVLNTIQKTFAGQCTLYRDHHQAPDDSSHTDGYHSEEEEAHADFANVVIFCRKGARPGPVTFIAPEEGDFRGRKSYERLRPSLEIPFPSSTRNAEEEDQILHEGEEDLWSAQQRESALRHWRIMRSIIPDGVWELW